MPPHSPSEISVPGLEPSRAASGVLRTMVFGVLVPRPCIGIFETDAEAGCLPLDGLLCVAGPNLCGPLGPGTTRYLDRRDGSFAPGAGATRGKTPSRSVPTLFFQNFVWMLCSRWGRFVPSSFS